MYLFECQHHHYYIFLHLVYVFICLFTCLLVSIVALENATNLWLFLSHKITTKCLYFSLSTLGY